MPCCLNKLAGASLCSFQVVKNNALYTSFCAFGRGRGQCIGGLSGVAPRDDGAQSTGEQAPALSFSCSPGRTDGELHNIWIIKGYTNPHLQPACGNEMRRLEYFALSGTLPLCVSSCDYHHSNYHFLGL